MFQRIWSRVYAFFFAKTIGFLIMAVGSIAINAGNYLLVYMNTKVYQGTQQQFVLHYTVSLGIDYIDYWYYIFLFPEVGSGIVLLHLVLARLLWKSYRLLSYFLLCSMVMAEVVLLCISWFLLNIN